MIRGLSFSIGKATMDSAVSGRPAHGVDVAHGIGRGDLAETIGVIDAGREDVHGLDQGQPVAELVDARVVAGVGADEDVADRRCGAVRRGRVLRSFWLILEAQPAFSTNCVSGASSAASSSRSPAQRQTFFRLKRSQGQGSLGLQMQWPSLIDRPMTRFRFSRSIIVGTRQTAAIASSTIAVFVRLDRPEIEEDGVLLIREKTAARPRRSGSGAISSGTSGRSG